MADFRVDVERLLAIADVGTNGDRAWDLQVNNNGFYQKVLAQGSLGLGESYVEGWWDCPCLDEFFYRILRSDIPSHVKTLKDSMAVLKAKVLNLQSPSRSYNVGRHHYDMGNVLYKKMLDDRMIYSCAYWQDAKTLNQAQHNKLDLICRKLQLQPGIRLLDIGCGWGGTAKFAAENYGVEVVGITISQKQAAYATELCHGLPVTIKLLDYRKIEDRFDRIVSVGMFEHVGYKNYRTFLEICRSNLKEDGLFLLHTIGGNVSTSVIDSWIEKYIFPNAMLPSARQITKAAEDLFVIEDWHNLGVDYDRTLMSWFTNFDTSWPDLKDNFDSDFYRMWKYYLLSCAGSFRARRNQVWQIVFSPHGVDGGYAAPR